MARGKGKPFEPGNKLAKGGKRPGAGAKPNWYKQECEAIIRDRKLITRVGDIAAGDEVFKRYSITGKPYKSAGSGEVQLHAFNSLADRAWGKASQEVQHTGKDGVDIFKLIRQAEEERGLPSSFDEGDLP